MQLVICRLLRFHRRRHPVVSSCCFTGLVRVGVKIPLHENCSNEYGHVAVVHEHVCRTLCSVCATGAGVAQARAMQLVICRFLMFHRRRDPVVSTRCFTGLVRVGVKIPQDGNRANGYGHAAVVPEHVWRTVYSVCATGARVARPVPCNS